MKHLKWLGGLAAMALLLSSPQDAARGAARAMAQWHASVAPALFPFLALMPLLTCDEAATVYELLLRRAMRALFDLPGSTAPALAVGMIVSLVVGLLTMRAMLKLINRISFKWFALYMLVIGIATIILQIAGVGTLLPVGAMGSPAV